MVLTGFKFGLGFVVGSAVGLVGAVLIVMAGIITVGMLISLLP